MSNHTNPYGDFDSPYGPAQQRQGSTSLYDLVPPGWESGASVEELRRQSTITSPLGHSVDHEEIENNESREETEDGRTHEEGGGEEEQVVSRSQSTQESARGRSISVSLATDDEEEKDKPSLMMTVGEYTKHGDGMGSYVSYRVNVKTNLVQYHLSDFVADRRYNDFVWLNDKLRERFKGYIIPPLPDKTIIQNRFDPQFIEARRRELGKFLNRLAAHPILASSSILQTFLESDAEEFSAAKTKKPPATVTKKVFSWMSSTVSHQLSPAIETDQQFDDKKQYLLRLESALEACLKTSEGLVTKEKEIVGALYEFGLGATAVGKAETENDDALAKHWLKLGDLCEQVRVLKQEGLSSQEIRLEEMLHDYLRIINSAKLAMEARLQALSELQQTEKIVNTKKERKEKVAGSPKAGAIEQEYQETVKKQESAKEEFEMITEILRKELDRFEKTKGREIAKALKDYAKENMDTTVQILDQWKKLLDQLQSI